MGTEPEREHKVLHRQQRHRLDSLGSRPWSWHSVLCQPGVQPVQGRWQPRGHQAATRREQTPGSSLATTIPLATASSDSLEALELLPSLTAFLAVPVVKELSNIL